MFSNIVVSCNRMMDTKETEKELLTQIRRGDRQALHSLYSRYVGYAMAVGLRYVADRDEAQDVVQDSFVRVFSSISKFEYRGEGSLKYWVLRIVTNEALRYLKKRSRLSFIDDVPNMPVDNAESDHDPDVQKIPPTVLNRLITELPIGYRLVLNLYVFEQKSHKEIAKELGIKEGTSASQYLRAKKLLARKIKEYLNNNDDDEQG